MHFIITFKFKKDRINSNREKGYHRLFRCSRAVNSLVSRQIWQNFNIQALIYVLVTCKYQKNWTINSRKKVDAPSSHDKYIGVHFRRSGADDSVAGSPIWPKFELVRDIMHALVTCKLKMDLINRNREKVATSNFRRSRAANSIVSSGIWPKLELIQALINVFITCTCKYKNIVT